MCARFRLIYLNKNVWKVEVKKYTAKMFEILYTTCGLVGYKKRLQNELNISDIFIETVHQMKLKSLAGNL